jgi:hypothetical protein
VAERLKAHAWRAPRLRWRIRRYVGNSLAVRVTCRVVELLTSPSAGWNRHTNRHTEGSPGVCSEHAAAGSITDFGESPRPMGGRVGGPCAPRKRARRGTAAQQVPERAAAYRSITRSEERATSSWNNSRKTVCSSCNALMWPPCPTTAFGPDPSAPVLSPEALGPLDAPQRRIPRRALPAGREISSLEPRVADYTWPAVPTR